MHTQQHATQLVADTLQLASCVFWKSCQLGLATTENDTSAAYTLLAGLSVLFGQQLLCTTHLTLSVMHMQVARRVLQVNITATLGVDVAPGASDEDVEAALAAANLSADEPIGMLASNPDVFFGRTTKVCACLPDKAGCSSQRNLF